MLHVCRIGWICLFDSYFRLSIDCMSSEEGDLETWLAENGLEQ